MITFVEIVGNTPLWQIPLDHQINIEKLLKKMNLIRLHWAKPMIVTSGYRTREDHNRIYEEINRKRAEKKLLPKRIPLASKHLKGQAVDISDSDGSLYRWCMENEALLVQVGLWCEVKDDQARVHFQIVPPLSGRRFFIP